MSFTVQTPYMGVGFAVVWVVLWATFFAYELRSPRDDELGASFIIATSVTTVAILTVVFMLVIGWAFQTFAPIFG